MTKKIYILKSRFWKTHISRVPLNQNESLIPFVKHATEPKARRIFAYLVQISRYHWAMVLVTRADHNLTVNHRTAPSLKLCAVLRWDAKPTTICWERLFSIKIDPLCGPGGRLSVPYGDFSILFIASLYIKKADPIVDRKWTTKKLRLPPQHFSKA